MLKRSLDADALMSAIDRSQVLANDRKQACKLASKPRTDCPVPSDSSRREQTVASDLASYRNEWMQAYTNDR